MQTLKKTTEMETKTEAQLSTEEHLPPTGVRSAAGQTICNTARIICLIIR